MIDCCVTITADLARGRHEARHLVAGAGADEHRVGALGQVDGEGVHGASARCFPATGLLPGAVSVGVSALASMASMMRSATAAGLRSSTSSTTSASSA